jgi:hypothetical protein
MAAKSDNTFSGYQACQLIYPTLMMWTQIVPETSVILTNLHG